MLCMLDNSFQMPPYIKEEPELANEKWCYFETQLLAVFSEGTQAYDLKFDIPNSRIPEKYESINIKIQRAALFEGGNIAGTTIKLPSNDLPMIGDDKISFTSQELNHLNSVKTSVLSNDEIAFIIANSGIDLTGETEESILDLPEMRLALNSVPSLYYSLVKLPKLEGIRDVFEMVYTGRLTNPYMIVRLIKGSMWDKYSNFLNEVKKTYRRDITLADIERALFRDQDEAIYSASDLFTSFPINKYSYAQIQKVGELASENIKRLQDSGIDEIGELFDEFIKFFITDLIEADLILRDYNVEHSELSAEELYRLSNAEFEEFDDSDDDDDNFDDGWSMETRPKLK